MAGPTLAVTSPMAHAALLHTEWFSGLRAPSNKPRHSCSQKESEGTLSAESGGQRTDASSNTGSSGVWHALATSPFHRRARQDTPSLRMERAPPPVADERKSGLPHVRRHRLLAHASHQERRQLRALEEGARGASKPLGESREQVERRDEKIAVGRLRGAGRVVRGISGEHACAHNRGRGEARCEGKCGWTAAAANTPAMTCKHRS